MRKNVFLKIRKIRKIRKPQNHPEVSEVSEVLKNIFSGHLNNQQRLRRFENAMKLEDDNLNSALASLLPRERRLIAMRQAGATFTEIGAVFSRSAQWAHVEYGRAMQRLKSKLKRGARAG